ncbi:hypothetical protein ACE6H2_003423 [Prunus campanulata]
MKFKSIQAMQNLHTAPYLKTKKKLRSELPRRRRSQISPVLYSSLKFNAPSETSGFSSFSVNSNSCSYFGGEVSCESSRVSVGSESEARTSLRKRHFDETEKHRKILFRRVTRSYNGGKAEKKEVGGDGEPEVSESSCVESNAGADFGGFVDRKLKLKSRRGKGSEIVNEIRGNEGSEAVSRPEISESDKISLEFKENEVTSFNSGIELCSESKLAEKTVKDRAPEFEFPGISENYFGENFEISNSEVTIEQRPDSLQIDSDLGCKEQFSYDDVSEYSSSQTLSELQSNIFDENSELSLSEYTPSIYFNSGSEFSECSDEDSTHSPTFTLLLQYREEFTRSSTALYFIAASCVKELYKDDYSFLKFEDEEDEASYQLLRNRERIQVFLRDYTEEYSSTTECGDLILQQRWQMVRWIVERSNQTKLQQETKFLGVSLLDRFLSKGFFKSKRILQIVGIACLTLATRIEENQPYNCVRKKDFHVGSNVYSRCEVVAMEWLVQEVLSFQCFLPTIYNFLWFYLRAARADAQVEKRAKYLAVLQMSDHVQLRYWPSTVAAALVILASLEGNHEASRQRVIETHVRTEGDDLHECIELIGADDVLTLTEPRVVVTLCVTSVCRLPYQKRWMEGRSR